ncbi:MAG: lactate utilization protein [Alphaproteobacteria bacterium]|nr:lactate utilization protein [Alphaproteobacteria bacterium]
MNPSRDQILGSIRRSFRRGPLAPEALAACETRLVTHRRNLIPERARTLPPRGQVELFVTMAEAVNATVTRVKDARDVPAAIAEYLARFNLPQRLVRAPDPVLDELPWSGRPLLETRRGVAEDSDLVGVTACFAAIAETGTLMLHSGAAGPTRNNFLPDTHIAVVRGDQVVAAYEDGWDRLRAARGGADGGVAMPRTVNFITGPSRTADIEQKIELGAHGPRRLHIVLVEDGEAS